MALHKVEDIRNIAFCGHGTAGKTTLVDKFLNKTGTVKRPASVDDKTSICDFDEEEKHHKHTIEASLVHFEHGGKHFNVIDTPGYPDFIGQTIGALRAVDVAVIVINAHSGIGVNTRRVFKESGAAGLGRIIVINKMDTENIDYPKLLGSIQELFGSACVPYNVPIGSGHDFKGVASVLHPPADTTGALIDPNTYSDKLLESIIEIDEEVTAKYFEGEVPDDAHLADLAAHAVAGGTLIPVLCCAGKADLGVNELLDALALCAPSPELVPRKAKDAAGNEVELKPDPAGPLVAQVFKTRIDPFVQKISFVRLYSGTLKKEDTVHASTARKGLKIAQLFRVQASETQPIDAAGAGDIVALTKMEELHTNCTLGDYTMTPIKFPTPMVGLAVTPKTRGDEAKLSGALHKLVEEDPTFHTDRDQQTHELVATGMSELHLQLLRERLKRRDKVEVESHEPKIPYRETIANIAEGSYRHKKQSGGRGQFGEVHIRMYPFPEGTKVEDFVTKARFPSMREFHFDKDSNFIWVDSIVGGTIPNNFLPAVEKGFKERLGKGVIAGYRIKTFASKCTSANIIRWIARKPLSRQRARWPSAMSSSMPSRRCWNRL